MRRATPKSIIKIALAAIAAVAILAVLPIPLYHRMFIGFEPLALLEWKAVRAFTASRPTRNILGEQICSQINQNKAAFSWQQPHLYSSAQFKNETDHADYWYGRLAENAEATRASCHWAEWTKLTWYDPMIRSLVPVFPLTQGIEASTHWHDRNGRSVTQTCRLKMGHDIHSAEPDTLRIVNLGYWSARTVKANKVTP